MRQQVVRRREAARVLKGDDSRTSSDFPGSPEYLLIEALKTATIIVQYSREIFNTLDKTIPGGTKERKQSFDISDLGEAILGLDKALVESINAKRESSAIKVAPIKREGVIFNDCANSEVKSADNLFEAAQDYFRLQSDVRSFDLKRPLSYRFVFQSINSYTFVALRELILTFERVYDECCESVSQLVQYCEMVFSKLIPELEHSFFHCKLDSANLRMEIELLKQHCDGIDWVESSNFEELLKKHKNDLLKQMIDKLILLLNQSIERIAVLIVMHPVNDSENLTPICRLLWNVSVNMFRPLLYYLEKIKVQVGNHNSENKIESQNPQDYAADKRGFSYTCDRLITEYRAPTPEKPLPGGHITRDRRSSDATVAKPSYASDNSELPPSPRKERQLSARRAERVKSTDQGRIQPIPPKLNFDRLPPIEEEELESEQLTEDGKSSQTKSLTRSGKLAGLFSASPRKNSRGLPDFSPPGDGDQASPPVQLPTTTTLARGSISTDVSVFRYAEELAADDAPQGNLEELYDAASADLSQILLAESGNTDADDTAKIKAEDLDEAQAMLNKMFNNL